MRDLRKTECKKQVTVVTQKINDDEIQFARLRFVDARASFLRNLRIHGNLMFIPGPPRQIPYNRMSTGGILQEIGALKAIGVASTHARIAEDGSERLCA